MELHYSKHSDAVVASFEKLEFVGVLRIGGRYNVESHVAARDEDGAPVAHDADTASRSDEVPMDSGGGGEMLPLHSPRDPISSGGEVDRRPG